jgi:hypothetical protein
MNMLATPEWTEYRKKNGLDPLGMQNTSVGLYQTLLPGISNVTLRIRYYGLYAWLASNYANTVGDTNPRTWQRFLRRAEALYALVAQCKGGENGVAGTRWAAARLGDADGEIDFGADAEPGSPTHYLMQSWGAYGAAYGSQLFEMGILSRTHGHEIPVPSADRGEKIAAAFEAELGAIAPRFLQILHSGRVGRDDLDTLAPVCPSEIGADTAERQLYEDLLFARFQTSSDADVSRRSTLLLVLSLSKQLGRLPDPDDIRWALYAGRLSDGAPIDFSEKLRAQRDGWWAYQSNDLSHICFEALLKYVLDLLASYPDGVTLQALLAEAVSGIRSAAGSAFPSTWSSHLASLPPTDNALSEDKDTSELNLVARIMNAARAETMLPADIAWDAVRLLGVLRNRVMQEADVIEEHFGAFDGSVFRSVLTELRFVENRRDEPLEVTLAAIMESRIVRRHLWIAMRKLRYQGDYTFLIETDDGKVRLRGMNGPVFTNPRLGPAVTFLKDIGLLDARGVTPAGLRCLEEFQ